MTIFYQGQPQLGLLQVRKYLRIAVPPGFGMDVVVPDGDEDLTLVYYQITKSQFAFVRHDPRFLGSGLLATLVEQGSPPAEVVRPKFENRH